MQNILWLSESNIDDILTVYEDKHVLFKICMEIVLYTTELSSKERRKAVLTMLEDYTQLFESDIHWTANSETGRWKKINGMRSYAHPEDWLLSIGDREWDFVYKGGKDKSDASDIFFLTNGRPAFENHLGMVCARFPLDIFGNKNFSFQKILQRWAELLTPWHGHAGLSLARSDILGESAQARLQEADILLRFSGLQFCHYSEGLYLQGGGLYDGIRCADWLLLLSTPFVERLGGLPHITQAMKPMPIYPYSDGLILQAGEYPQLGSTYLNKNIPEYEHLARVVDTIRAKNLVPQFYELNVKSPEFPEQSKELFDAWCARFSHQQSS